MSNGKTLLVGACTHNRCYAWPVKPKSPLKGFFFCGLGSNTTDTYFRDNRVGYLVDDSGEPSASANRGGGNSGVEEYHAKNASIGSVPVGGAETSNSTWRTDRAIAGFGTTRSDSLSSLGKCLASPKPKQSRTGYLIDTDASLPQSLSPNRLGFGVVFLAVTRFLSLRRLNPRLQE